MHISGTLTCLSVGQSGGDLVFDGEDGKRYSVFGADDGNINIHNNVFMNTRR